MKSRSSRLTWALVALLVAAPAAMVLAEEAADDEEREEPINVAIRGENYCLGCDLGAQGAASACVAFGCQHALKVESAVDADGNPVEEIHGWVLHYLLNEHGAALATEEADYHGATVTLNGKVFKNERTIDVAEIHEAETDEDHDHDHG